jgi:hypothetical protein
MAVRIHPHARERAPERGATEDEIAETVEFGIPVPAKLGRSGFRRNFSFRGLGGDATMLQSRLRRTPSERKMVAGW